MSHVRLTILLVAIFILIAFVSKLLWDEYQMNRAFGKVSAVKAIFNDVRQFPGAGTLGDAPVSVNEYSAVLWQRYQTTVDCSDIRSHFDAETARNAFEFANESSAYGNTNLQYRKGEFEVGVLCNPSEAGYSFSVNWYGRDR